MTSATHLQEATPEQIADAWDDAFVTALPALHPHFQRGFTNAERKDRNNEKGWFASLSSEYGVWFSATRGMGPGNRSYGKMWVIPPSEMHDEMWSLSYRGTFFDPISHRIGFGREVAGLALYTHSVSGMPRRRDMIMGTIIPVLEPAMASYLSAAPQPGAGARFAGGRKWVILPAATA